MLLVYATILKLFVRVDNTPARNQAVIERNNSSVYLLISHLC